MVGLGFLMLLVALWGWWLRRGDRVYEHKGFLWLANWMIPAGSIATLAGWYVTETGRQPWLVEGLIRTMEVASPLPAEKIVISLSLFVVVYSGLFVVYLYFMRKLIRKGPPSIESLKEHRHWHDEPGYAKALVNHVTQPSEEKI